MTDDLYRKATLSIDTSVSSGATIAYSLASQNGSMSVGTGGDITGDIYTKDDLVFSTDVTINGDVFTEGAFSGGCSSDVFGNVHAIGDAGFSTATTVHGDMHTGGKMTLGTGGQINGDVYAQSLSDLSTAADVTGNIYVQTGGLTLGSGTVVQQGIYVGGDTILNTDVQIGTEIYADGTLTTGTGAKITGDIYATQDIVIGTGNDISGTIKGETTLDIGTGSIINGDVHINGNISLGTSAIIDGDVYTDGTITIGLGSNITGNTYPAGSITPPITSIPAPETTFSVPADPFASEIATWESEAEAGGIATCSFGKYQIDLFSGPQTIGPLKIPCDLEVFGSSNDLTLKGPVWVTGEVDLETSVKTHISPSLGNKSAPIISGGQIKVGTGANFTGSGDSSSFVILATESGGASPADISLLTSVTGDVILYAPNGKIQAGTGLDIHGTTYGNTDIVAGTAAIIKAIPADLQNIITTTTGGGTTIVSQTWKETE